MAVYKPSYCFPFSNSVDSRVGKMLTTGEIVPEVYFSGKIETSNKNITGYKIKILDSDNNIVFEGAGISLFSELSILSVSETTNKGINTGVNGSYFKIPVIQKYNLNEPLLVSYNCLYYDIDINNNDVWKYISDNAPIYTNLTYTDNAGNQKTFTNSAGSYKWIITLYQGDTTTLTKSEKAPTLIDYTLLKDKEYDMVLTQGQVLGSTAKRIQIEPSEQIIQNNYVQLLDANRVSIATRSLVQTYDATLGHIYPIEYSTTESAFTENLIEQASKICIYKYSNSEEDIKGRDIVVAATVTNGNITLDQNTITVDGHTILNEERILVKNQTAPAENGIYKTSTTVAWQRVGDANTFAELIGRVVYVSDGDTNKGKNFICQARAGGSFDSPTYTPVYFLEEKPLVLYPNDIYYTTDYYIATLGTTSVDGYTVQTGETVLTLNGIYKRVASTWDTAIPLVSTKNYAVKYGSLNGGKIFKYTDGSPSTLLETYDLQYPDISKNSTISTYIKPFVGLEIGSKLFFNNDIIAPIIITSINPITWKITHTTLTTGKLSSSNPYTYKIKTYLKTSEENPFYTYSTPYLSFGLEEYSYFVTLVGKTFMVIPSTGGEYEYFTVRNFIIKDGETIYDTRSISISANYIQDQNISWKSFRWLLSNISGTVIQDTGKIYDGNIQTTFYGLEKLTEYYIILLVEDELGNSLSLGHQFRINITTTSLGVQFTANFNGDLHANELIFKDNGFVKPTIVDGINTTVFEPLDKSLSFSDFLPFSSGVMKITGVDGSNVPNNPNEVLAESTQNGVTFKHWFTEDQINISDTNPQLLKTNDNGILSISSQHILNGNFCGNIIKFDIEQTNSKIATLSIFLPDNFTDVDRSVLNENRNKIGYSIQYTGDTINDIITNYIPDITLFVNQIGLGLNLNRQLDSINDIDFLPEYEYLEFDKVTITKEDNSTTKCKIWDNLYNSDAQINNLCLGDPSKYSVWTDKKLVYGRFGSFSQNFIELDINGIEVDNEWDDNKSWTDGNDSKKILIVYVARHADIATRAILFNIYINNVDNMKTEGVEITATLTTV